jgi:hypothetical protein
VTARSTLARALRLLATLADGTDPAALAIAEATRARGEAARAVDLARLALTAAERAEDDDAVTMSIAVATRDVVGAMLREGVARASERGAQLSTAVERWDTPPLIVARSRELLRDLGCAEEEPPPGAGGDD